MIAYPCSPAAPPLRSTGGASSGSADGLCAPADTPEGEVCGECVSAYRLPMWRCALWGLVGAAVNRALIYLEDGKHTVVELAEMFNVSRPTAYRVLDCDKAAK